MRGRAAAPAAGLHLELVARVGEIQQRAQQVAGVLPQIRRLAARVHERCPREQVVDTHTGGEPTRVVVAGGPDVAIFQPEFTPDSRRILYVSDETGWGRIAITDLESGDRRWLTAEGAEYATPAWVQGLRTYGVSADGRFVAFSSAASNLVEGDTNGVVDVFVRDRQVPKTERASATGPLRTNSSPSAQSRRPTAFCWSSCAACTGQGGRS